MIWVVTLIHLASISIWAGGLIVVPFLLAQRRGLEGEALHRLHRLSRTLYVGLLSPAAFLAIASGTTLIFLRATYAEWFSIKLVLVGLLAALHVRAGLLILRVFDPGGSIRRIDVLASTSASIGVVATVLLVVLWKPRIDAMSIAPSLFRPGRLAEILAPAIAWLTP